MRRVSLTRGASALVDDEDFEAVTAGPPWRLLIDKSGRRYGVRTVRTQDGRRTSQLMHRVIAPGIALVDHANGNGLDNRRANLRPATPAENARNARGHGCSGLKGVSAAGAARPGQFRARIRVNGRTEFLGHFPTALAAAQAYDDAARVHFGEFAWLNFP